MLEQTGGPAFPSTHMHGQEEGMTLRQYAAIKLRVPNSGTDWLDDMICVSLRHDLAARALEVELSIFPNMSPREIVRRAGEVADTMLRARSMK